MSYTIQGESGLNRKNIVDTRVHACLYFIPPYGHGLRQIDLEFLKRLQYKVNLIPIIAKADGLTIGEVRTLITINTFAISFKVFVSIFFSPQGQENEGENQPRD